MQVINNNTNKSNYYVTNIVRLTSYKLFISTYAHSVKPCLLPRLYIPTILVVGLHGWLLSPLLIVVCDMFVYSEFMIHPIVLLVSSDTLRLTTEGRAEVERSRGSHLGELLHPEVSN